MDIEEAENRLFQLKQSMELLDLVTGKTIEEDTKLNIKAIETVLSELEKKEAIINEMAEWIKRIDSTIFCNKSECNDNCKECVIKEFTKKVEGK